MRLKESDPLFELILGWIMSAEWDMTLTIREAMVKAESLIKAHIENPQGSELSRKCPGIGMFFTELPLARALDYINTKVALEERRFVPPSFSEVRQIFNLAQVYALKDKVKMLTFDADDTLYDHGMDLEVGTWIVDALVTLMEAGYYIAVVTAAGYPGKPERYAARFNGLLEHLKAKNAPVEVTNRFFVMGGECNYLFRVVPGSYDLFEVPITEWQTESMKNWKDEDICKVLDVAEEALRDSCKRMRLDVQFLRKSRAIGCFPTRAEDRIAYEALEDVALAIQDKMTQKSTFGPAGSPVPFCAFNGNRDVWVDVGNKSYGIQALLEYLGIEGEHTCHLGDRFTNTGNDKASRGVAMTVWVTNPIETEEYLYLFLKETGIPICITSAEARPSGPQQGTVEWQKAQVVQRNTAA
jgi:IMP and pyridine-specific 5'-nucleotidase